MCTFLATPQLFFQTGNCLLCTGRDHTTLRGATLARKELPFAIASRFEHRLDEAQHSAVGYSLSHQREEFFMVRGPEEISEIRIHDPLGPALYLFPHFAQGILR